MSDLLTMLVFLAFMIALPAALVVLLGFIAWVDMPKCKRCKIRRRDDAVRLCGRCYVVQLQREYDG